MVKTTNQHSLRDTIAPVAAGVIAGVAATAVAVALQKKENREKITDAANKVQEQGGEMVKEAAKTIQKHTKELKTSASMIGAKGGSNSRTKKSPTKAKK